MAMTVAEAKDLLSAFGALCGKDTVPAKNLQQIAALLESQQQTIDGLKCCGNCAKWLGLYGAHCRLNMSGPIKHQSDKCDLWEG